jgi:succinate dehydrogenase / fumarate reductase cytochrome b subunit
MSTVAPDSPLKRPRREFRNIHVLQLLSYRLPAAGMVSILHRISGAVLFLLLPLLLWWFELSLASELSFVRLAEVTGLWWVKLILLGLIWAFLHHLVAGVRYLVLDLHVGIDKAPSHASALVVFAVSLVMTAIAGLRLFGVF